MSYPLEVLRARAEGTSVDDVVRCLADQIEQPRTSALIFFACPSLDFDRLARKLQDRFDCPTIGCTTAGEILSEDGYATGSVVASTFASPLLRMHATFLPTESTASMPGVVDSARQLLANRTLGLPDNAHFAMLLADGLGRAEERLAAKLFSGFGSMPLVGGSAADAFEFKLTRIACNGDTRTRGAVTALFECGHPFEVFHSNHFIVTDNRFVVTAASPEERRVLEIDGLPANEAYASLLGITPQQLTGDERFQRPVVLQIGGDAYARSVNAVEPDGSITFFCAIEDGLTLRLAETGNLVEQTRTEMDRIRNVVPDLEVSIVFDCAFRRFEIQSNQQFSGAREALSQNKVIGFNTYGEQYLGMHVNHTLTGVAIGAGVRPGIGRAASRAASI